MPLLRDAIRSSVPANRPAVALEDAIRVAASGLTVESDRRTERAREAITGLINKGLLGCHDGWLWIV